MKRERRERIEKWKREKAEQERQQQLEQQQKKDTDTAMEEAPPAPVPQDTASESVQVVTATSTAAPPPTAPTPAPEATPVKKFTFGKSMKSTTATTTTNSNNKKPTGMKMGFGLGKNKLMMTTPNNKKSLSEMNTNDTPAAATTMDVDQHDDDADIDPLDAYMLDVTAEARKINEEDQKRMQDMEYTESNKRNVMNGEEDDDQQKKSDDEYGSDPEDILAMAAKKVKRKDLAAVDHSKMNYETFRKDFYIEPAELRDMTNDQVDLLRVELDGIKIRGVDCPKPIQKWTHCGLPAGCLEIIRKLKFDKPTSIQAQAVPAIMHGRDVIGVAKTGSGKTIAFLLPMFRHIKDQRPLEMGEGPMAIIMTPTRELATQIHRECKPFLKVLGLKAVCAYGGSPIKDQIADLKRGAEIIVCTPGRMIDLLCANSGRVTNLARVTYMVLDEADRMFDMGFEPQVMKIVNNVRPNRQTVLFSATFPRQMEALARKVLKKPLEITVGGRSVVCSDVEQIVEVREDATKFMRLLEILGQFYNDEDDDARVLIFVDRQEAADNLLRDLIRKGYVCQSLHGGKDQVDRDSTIADFKSGATNILIATSVAARGLDVKQLKLVVNYECPNHMEDYVHRVGRTGRAGNKGTAYTFITPTQERYAMDICKALRLSGQAIPPDLQVLTDDFQTKVKSGQERFAGSGFGGKGLERFDKDRDMVKKIQKKAYGGDDLEESDEEVELESTRIIPGQPRAATMDTTDINGITTTTTAAASSSEQGSSVAVQAARKAAEVAARLMATAGMNKSQTMETTDDSEDARPVFAEEININDFPQKARWKVTNREQISQISEITGAAITTRGTFFPTGKQPGPNERKLYLFIEGDSEMVLENAKREIKRILEEATVASLEAEARTGGGAPARYSVV
ncbi:unnamed protein product [Absidia cylindrospora]